MAAHLSWQFNLCLVRRLSGNNERVKERFEGSVGTEALQLVTQKWTVQLLQLHCMFSLIASCTPNQTSNVIKKKKNVILRGEKILIVISVSCINSRLPLACWNWK